MVAICFLVRHGIIDFAMEPLISSYSLLAWSIEIGTLGLEAENAVTRGQEQRNTKSIIYQLINMCMDKIMFLFLMNIYNTIQVIDYWDSASLLI
jgi:hypothetical protein